MGKFCVTVQILSMVLLTSKGTPGAAQLMSRTAAVSKTLTGDAAPAESTALSDTAAVSKTLAGDAAPAESTALSETAAVSKTLTGDAAPAESTALSDTAAVSKTLTGDAAPAESTALSETAAVSKTKAVVAKSAALPETTTLAGDAAPTSSVIAKKKVQASTPSKNIVAIPIFVDDNCIGMEQISSQARMDKPSIISSTTVDSLGECARTCQVTSGCVGVAVEQQVMMDPSTSGTCLLGTSDWSLAEDKGYYLYRLCAVDCINQPKN